MTAMPSVTGGFGAAAMTEMGRLRKFVLPDSGLSDQRLLLGSPTGRSRPLADLRSAGKQTFNVRVQVPPLGDRLQRDVGPDSEHHVAYWTAIREEQSRMPWK